VMEMGVLVLVRGVQRGIPVGSVGSRRHD
jgi:hypothetical protein